MISNRKARPYVQERKPFTGSNTLAHWYGESIYVVYSYGTHWPLFIWKAGQWYENEDRYSVTTSRHRSQLHPTGPTIKLSTVGMKNLIYKEIEVVKGYGAKIVTWN